jgi:hypothetical protein
LNSSQQANSTHQELDRHSLRCFFMGLTSGMRLIMVGIELEWYEIGLKSRKKHGYC